jgi:hypothetical protein
LGRVNIPVREHQRRSILPNYEAHIKEVFITVAEKCITQQGTLEILSYVLESPKRIYSTSQLVDHRRDMRSVEEFPCLLPSWVPDWRQHSDKWITRCPTRLEWPSQQRRHMKYCNFNACNNQPAEAQFDPALDNQILQVQGLEFDSVFSISEEITSYSAPKKGLEEWYKSLTDGSRKFYGMCMDEAFIRTILLDTMDEGKTVRRLCQEDFQAWNVWWKVPGNDKSESQKQFPISINMRRSLQMAITRRFFVTAGGHIGMGGMTMQKGDMVYVLAGGNYPLILRRDTLKGRRKNGTRPISNA